MTDQEQIIWLAALLHDIGKFRERTFEPLPTRAQTYRAEAKYSHEPFSALFVDTYGDVWTNDRHTLRQLVLKHHAPSLPDEHLVSLADRLSASERAEAVGDLEGARGRAESVQRAILSRLEIGERPKEVYHPLAPLSLDRATLFPQAQARCSEQIYRDLWQRFSEELGRAPHGDTTTLLALLRKFAWAIPSDTSRDTIPDISLYAHLKTTAAIAVCLKREEFRADEIGALEAALTRRFKGETLSLTEETLLKRPISALIKGDISGTQDFLYLLTSHGAARGLRGRSFYLQLLTETIADWLLRQLDLPSTNLLYAGGGHFYLLAPYRQTETHLDTLRQQIAEKLWKAHRGDLSLTVGYVPVAVQDFLEDTPESKEKPPSHAFAAKWDEVSKQAERHKQRKWRDLNSKPMMQALFTARQRGTTAQDTCQVCHNAGQLVEEGGVRKCRHCRQFEELGRQLRDPTHLVLFTVPDRDLPENSDWRDTLRTFGVSAHLIRDGEAVPQQPPDASQAIVYTLDSTEFLTDDMLDRFRWDNLPVSYDFRLLADATPRISTDEVADYDHLAEAADGVKWLGVLRMDVDSLGEVFKGGLGQQATISRMSTLSESLRLFFEGWVPQLCRQHNRFEEGGKDRVYLLYAGGDDLFVVGAWSALPELAKQIRDEFRAFAGGDHVTLSGGIAIEHEKYPLYQLADDAKRALDDHAKEFKRPNGGKPKDALCFLQTAMGWERFKEIAEWKQELIRMLKPGDGMTALPRGFLTRLSEIYALYTNNAARKRRIQREGGLTEAQMQELIHYNQWQWRLVYQLRRFGERHPHFAGKIEQLQQAIRKPQDGLISHLHVLARWSDLLTREG